MKANPDLVDERKSNLPLPDQPPVADRSVSQRPAMLAVLDVRQKMD
jgi:hypothetical protein